MSAPQPDFGEVVSMLSQRIGDLTAQLVLAQSVINGYQRAEQDAKDDTRKES